MLAELRRISRLDVAVAALVGMVQLGGTTAASFHEQALGPRPFDLGGYLLLALGPVLLLWRTRYPEAVLVGVFAATLAYALLDYPRGPIYLALIVAFVHAVLGGYRVLAYGLLAVGYLSFTLLVAQVTGHDQPDPPFLVGIAAWLLVLLVGSELIRIRQAYVGERRRRRLEVELTREEELRRRASEERLEIARELHDVMAHSISLINVQAGVALELMDRRPEQARQALTAIKAASKDALLEVQTMLSALRGTGETAPRSPSLSLAALDQLVSRARLAGVRVDTEVTGEPVLLPADLDQAAARIVQEALTNVARHAVGAQARVLVHYQHGPRRANVLIVIENDAPAADPAAPVRATGGRGIAGMRERAAAFDGTVQAGARAEGGFAVRAELPTEADTAGVAGTSEGGPT
jgi:signal transduction histidine kinase